ncbi:uncharacterized protein LOC133038528 [Cannabis sativa]|uniref:uncharacterized protein LOC133038528 n=1 Tax=Cannabis sativa TaxID=3483 RepID=UPI0029CA1500|nr:uncharacterized protein LOC133038528 [Cannabis sativa]
MVLCNPCLKESMILPEPNNTTIKGPYPKIGFEIDSINNDFKCVAIWLDGQDCTVEAYTVGSDSWRELNIYQDIIYSLIGTQLNDGICWRGVCYWFVWSYSYDACENILTFNMSDEEVELIALPSFDEPLVPDYLPHLSVWKDSVVMCWRFNGNILHISTMDGTKVVKVPLENCFRVLPFSKNDDILIKVWKDCRVEPQLVSCNLRRGMLRELVYVLELDRNIFAFLGCFYVKSLVSIRRGGEV